MATAPERYRAQWPQSPPPTVLKSVGADTSVLSFATLLTFPIKDIAGDYVEPTGGDYTPHIEAGGVIDLEHGRDRHYGRTPVASAFDSLWEPGGEYSVRLKALNFAPDGEPEHIETVPIGTEYYDRNLRHSMQVFAMREQGVRLGTSLEFEPVKGYCKALGWSDLERREAQHFERYRVHRWTVCAMGVNPGALIGKSLSIPQVPRPLDKILADKRILVGANYEPLCPLILKAFAPEDPRRKPKRTVVVVEAPKRVEQKAMPTPAPVADDDTETDDTADTSATDADLTTANDDAVADTEGLGEGGNAITAAYKHADTLRMLVEEIKADADKTDNPKLYADLMKLSAEVEAVAKKLDGCGDKHDGAMQAAKSGKSATTAPEADDDGEEAVTADTEPDMEMDEDGVRKAIRRPHRLILKALKTGTPVKQFPREQLTDGEPVRKSKTGKILPDPETTAVLAEFQSLKNRIDN